MSINGILRRLQQLPCDVTMSVINDGVTGTNRKSYDLLPTVIIKGNTQFQLKV